MRIVHVAAVLLIAAAGIAQAACGEVSGDDDPTPVQTWMITPASGTVTVQSPTVPADTPTTSPDQTPGTGTTIAIAGVGNEFDLEEITAPAGTITIEFDNRDPGIVHNIHFFEGENARGEDAGETELEVGPTTQTLTMTLEPGTYFYQCDAHPQTMKGVLTVT